MDNPDVAGLEVCQRLAKAWPVVDRQITRRWYVLPEGEAYSGALATHLHLGYSQDSLVPARSIGEMLAEIRRRGWGCAIDATVPESGTEIQIFFGRDVAIADEDRLADALALALAEAMEKEAGSDQ